ncbi:hypothetical protein [Archangium lansingense]|uniref:Uncharacterized protein n=1 Tax=Archangium lansingense TaxID=2995310 RepID=A0ABT4APX3_9BACT|nr:hypothetical protein [Archangium lansinium]MCY1083745.1 hypothetical protein [Archangium lansinium]
MKHPTVAALLRGTWDYPIVVLETPSGIRRREGPARGDRFLLIEGHQRTRYLNVLAHRGVRTGPHQVFVLQSPITG